MRLDDHDDIECVLQKALRALNFWLPHVPAEGSEEVISRVATDAELLIWIEGDAVTEPDAETLGWIKLQPTSHTSSEGQQK